MTVEHQLFDSVRNKFSQPEELTCQIKEANRGLFLMEKRMLEKHLTSRCKILTIGCGAGREAFALAREGHYVTGADFVEPFIRVANKIAEEKHLSVPFTVMSATHLGFKKDTFDSCTMLTQLISNIPKAENRLKALQDVRHVLKPGGLLFITVLSRHATWKHTLYFTLTDVWRKILLTTTGASALEPGDYLAKTVSPARSSGKSFVHRYTLKEAVHNLRQAHFSVLECRSRREIYEEKETPGQRERDHILFFVARKSQ